jgi:2-methylcitrate dehydratase PrpD
MLHSPSVTERLAGFVTAARFEELPDGIAHQAKRALLNFFAVAIAGNATQTIGIALSSLAAFSGGKPATVVGRRERIDALSAAFLNAAGANVHDFCDTHVATALHPTAPVAPAILALSELQRVSGRDALLALVLGHEIESRIALAMSPSHYNKGWHITSTCGVFGAAAATGKLVGLEPRQMIFAFGLAATQSGGLCECLGTPAKSVSVGNASRNGLWSALLARDNFEGPPEPLTGVQGYYSAMAEAPKMNFLTDRLGDTWEIAGTAFKPYPGGFVMHPVLDCVLDWRRAHPAAVVEKVVVTGNPLLAARTDRPDIATGRESQVSIQHAVAAALVTGKAGLAEFTDACVADPKVAALRGKVSVRRDERYVNTAAAVEITTLDGQTYQLTQEAARGTAKNPLTDAEIETKLRDSAASFLPGHDVGPLIEAVWTLDAADDIAKLASLAVPRS